MKKRLPRIPDAELDIMLILWQEARPMRVSDICAKLWPTRPCAKAAVHTLLDRLAARNFVKIEMEKAAQPYKSISPLVTEEDYRASESETLIDKLCRGKWQPLIASLCESGKLTDGDLAEIEAILHQKREE